ncbi:hypothetical protein GQR58_010898 [Nymphon striatum]|nr:hypothetical protein GQR58_010898 [Nymphon striatum]
MQLELVLEQLPKPKSSEANACKKNELKRRVFLLAPRPKACQPRATRRLTSGSQSLCIEISFVLRTDQSTTTFYCPSQKHGAKYLHYYFQENRRSQDKYLNSFLELSYGTLIVLFSYVLLVSFNVIELFLKWSKTYMGGSIEMRNAKYCSANVLDLYNKCFRTVFLVLSYEALIALFCYVLHVSFNVIELFLKWSRADMGGSIEMQNAKYCSANVLDLYNKLIELFLKWSRTDTGSSIEMRNAKYCSANVFDLYNKCFRTVFLELSYGTLIVKECKAAENIQWAEDFAKRNLKFAGHILRGQDEHKLVRLVMEGLVEGKKDSGKQRRVWGDDLKEWSKNTSIGQVKRQAENRDVWKKMVHDLRFEDVT